ncbi:MAG: glycosyltransferase [Maritimibacter sp.]|nr:glycosyltransferase [Maritimibacter sp.]
MAIGGYTFVFDTEDAPKDKIFFDPTERRRSRLARLFRLGLGIALLWAVTFVSGNFPFAGLVDQIAFRQALPDAQQAMLLPPAANGTGDHDHDHDHGSNLGLASAEAYRAATGACAPAQTPMLAAMADALPARRIYGHLSTTRDNAELSLASSCGTIGTVMPEWIALKRTGAGFTLGVETADVREEVDTYVAAHAKAGASLLPVMRLDVTGATADYVAALREPATAEDLAGQLTATVDNLGADGLCLDVGQIEAQGLAPLAPFFTTLDAAFAKAEQESCIVVSGAGAAWKDKALTDLFDRIVLKLFQPAWTGSAPGPLAAETWFAETASEALERIGHERLVIALGNHAVDWTLGAPMPETLAYAELARRAAEAGASLQFSTETGNGMVAYRDEDGRSHRAWLLDAVSAHNQLKLLDALGLRNVAIWSLGNEDPGLWPLLRTDLGDRAAVVAALSDVRLDNDVHYTGEGPFLRVTASPATGLRFVDFAGDSGRIARADYAQLPEPFEVERYGAAPDGKLVLTFDDGPDATYTAQILDILRDTQTPAAFFVLGSRVMQEPALLQRMIDEGHEVGSHSFSHPRMDQISQTRAALELSMMHKLIAGYSGRDTRLYREPFLRAGGPLEAARIPALAAAQAEGALIAGMDIVPQDWDGIDAREIVDHVKSELAKGAGNVLLLHDGGGDRSETVKAVAILIAELRAEGYEFTTMASLIGQTRDQIMPPGGDSWPLAFDKASFEMISGARAALVAVFWAVLALGLARALFVFTLVVKHRSIPPIHTHHRPKAAFVIPAHNEEKSVRASIERVLKSDYDNFEVIVVDDGSTDDTFEEMQKASIDPRVKVFAQLNRGKWGALNTAIRNTDAEVLVCIDADTHIMPDALGHLVKHFFNPRVGAVAGKVVVGNRVNLLTRLQALEYITSQNFDRRAQDMLNSMIVVPGAIGAWRTEALREVGMYSGDTVTEDADITIAVNRAGYRISYEDQAVAYTEAPETVRLLMSQRLRWSLGMFQVAWKHRGALLEPRSVGRVALPDLVIFGYLFALMAPVADLFLAFAVWNLFAGGASDVAGHTGLFGLGPIAFAYLALPAFELFVAGYALKADKSESLWMLLLFPFQRFFYRQILYLSSIRAMLRAMTGVFTGWGRKRRMQRQLVAVRAA